MTRARTRAWVEVRSDAVRRNLRTVLEALGPEGEVIPMVKADAYGLGMGRTVGVVEPFEPRAYGVATVEEGRELRGMGVDRPVLVFSPLPADAYRAAAEAGLTVCLSSLDALGRLQRVGGARTGKGAPPAFQVEVDTGMGRAGFDWREADRWGPVVADAAEGLRWSGIYTHLHSADRDAGSVAVQHERFRDALGVLEERTGLSMEGSRDFMVHVANSPGVFRKEPRLPPLARPGIFLYGGRPGAGLPEPEGVVSVRARVVHLRDASPGTTLGYGATYRARGWERWATLGIGYGDGLPRAVGNRGDALLGGERVRVVGRVSMDMTVVNISGLDGVGLGDVATLIGRDGGEEITVDEVAEVAGTIGYEILTGLSTRLPRVWMDAGEDG